MENIIRKIFLLFVINYFVSCSGEKKVHLIAPTPYLNEFENDAPKILSHYVEADSDTVLETPSGAKITLTENQFTHVNGKKIEGNITVQVREYFSISEMLFGKLTTESDNRIIATDGMFYINAFDKKGDTLKLHPQKPILIELKKTEKDSGYYVFYDDKQNKNKFNWKKGNPVIVPEIWDTSSVKSYLSKIVNVLSVVELGFINCDKFIDNKDAAEITVTTNSDVEVPVFCTVVLKKYKSIVGGVFDGEKFSFKYLPFNEEAVLVCIGKVNEKYYLALKDFKITNGLKLNENLLPKSKIEAEQELRKLNNLHPTNL